MEWIMGILISIFIVLLLILILLFNLTLIRGARKDIPKDPVDVLNESNQKAFFALFEPEEKKAALRVINQRLNRQIRTIPMGYVEFQTALNQLKLVDKLLKETDQELEEKNNLIAQLRRPQTSPAPDKPQPG
ncbi:hypothetical protein [Arsenicibacter rosenii]|uniref:Uncharacterized protein n=1 Tax=Arsenicibacter rosenii TaxID=1750698 RepID=A0A1S2VBY1_9BACT|nr:hypothetical protein [Arsenicibacter rosenii]OIN55448.1 hypothetical protein BLX24_30590 [Arsenicibacter rosenii]